MASERFTDLIGCSVAVQNAGMGRISSVDLAAAVAEAGGLGMIGLPGEPISSLDAALDALAKRTSGSFGVNFLMPVVDRASVQLASSKARVVEFFWGDPDPDLVSAGHSGGALVAWQVASAGEAVAAGEAGCDFVIAQGIEAGGHQRGDVSLLPLLTEVRAAVDVPVLAAGGIGTPKDVAAAMSAGADGVRAGTRFVAAAESAAHPAYKEALVRASSGDAVRSGAFSVGCPLCPSTHGVLRSAVEAAEGSADDVVAELALPDGQRVPVPRFAGLPPTVAVSGNVEAMALYAGKSVGGVSSVQPAGEIVRELAAAI